MGNQINKPLTGFLLPESTFTWENRDTSVLSFNEASPRPGSPISNSALSLAKASISGGQDTDAEVYVSRAGQPNISPTAQDGMSVIHRAAAGTWKGWSGFGESHGFEGISNISTIFDFSHHDCVTIPSSQKVVAVYGVNVGDDGTDIAGPDSRVLDPSTWVWDAKVDIDDNDNPVDNYDVAIAIVPNERLIVMSLKDLSGASSDWRWTMRYSDDEAVSWTVGSTLPFSSIDNRLDNTSGLCQTKIVSDNQGNILFVRAAANGVFAVQYASSSQGAVFSQVGGDWTTSSPTMINLLKLKSGSLAMVAENNGGMHFTKISSPFVALEDATSVQINGSTPASVSAWVDDDGIVYAAMAQGARVRTWVSSDEGANWVEMSSSWPADGQGFNSGDSGSQYLPAAATTTMGRAVLLGNTVDSGGGSVFDGAVWVVQLGGWSNVEGQGWYDINTGNGVTWLGYEFPTTNSFWTESSTGGSLSQINGMRIDTTAQSFYWSKAIGSAFLDYKGEFEIEVQSGGSATSSQIVVRMNSGNGVNNAQANIVFSTTQYAVEDGGSGRGTVTHGVTGKLQIKYWFDGLNNQMTTWYKENTDELWTLGHDAVTITSGLSATTSSIEWGHRIAITAQSDWFFNNFAWSTDLGSLELFDEQTEFVGKALNQNSYPLPAIGEDDQVARLSMVSGPGFIGDLLTIDTAADYALSNAYWDVTPKPSVKWRSQDTNEHVVAAWDAGEGTLPGLSMGLMAVGCNCPQMIFEGSTGGAYTPICTLDFNAGFASVSYARTGDTIKANTTGTSGDRFIQRNEFGQGPGNKGGWVDLGSGKRRNIRRNTGGEWIAQADSLAAKAHITLDGVDGTEGATGTCDIYSASGFAVGHAVGDYTQFRLRIPAGNNADGYWEVGSFLIGGLAVFGESFQWGHSWSRARNASSRTDRGGTDFVTQEGQAPRTVTGSWQNGISLYPMRQSTSLDYYKADTGLPLVADEDVPLMAINLIEEIQSGQTPVGALRVISQTDGSTTDQSLFLFGRIVSDPEITHVLGNEGEGELYRVGTLTVKELV